MKTVVHVLSAILPALALVAACSDDVSVAPTRPNDVGAEDAAAKGDGARGEDAGRGAAPIDGGAVTTLRFAGRVGGEAFKCTSTYTALGTSSATVRPLDFRFYVSDVRLVRSDGAEVPFVLVQDGKWQYQNVALIDLEDKSGTCANGTRDTNDVLRGTAPAGTYTGVRFALGVPFALNHADVATAPSPLNLSGLFWSWNSGYKFARLDGKVQFPDGGRGDGGMMDDAGMHLGDAGMHLGDAGMHLDDGGMPLGDGGMHMGDAEMDMGPAAFNIHIGSTECQGDPADGGNVASCGRPTRGAVELTGFDPTKKAILADYAALVAESDLNVERGGAPGCMSGATDPECTPILKRLGIDPTTGLPNASTQAFFRGE